MEKAVNYSGGPLYSIFGPYLHNNFVLIVYMYEVAVDGAYHKMQLKGYTR